MTAVPASLPTPSPTHDVGADDMFRGMYWPLIVGFIAFVLLLVLIGWAVDRPGSGAGGGGKSSH